MLLPPTTKESDIMGKPIKPIEVQPLLDSFLVTGGSANTDLTCTGIKVGDDIVMAIELATSTNNPTDRKSVASIVTDGNIQFSVATTSDKIMVIWQKLR